MSECVREMTSKELIEQSSLSNKELILQRLKSENDKVNSRIGNLEKTVIEQRNLIESYRTVLKDMVYSNWLNWPRTTVYERQRSTVDRMVNQNRRTTKAITFGLW